MKEYLNIMKVHANLKRNIKKTILTDMFIFVSNFFSLLILSSKFMITKDYFYMIIFFVLILPLIYFGKSMYKSLDECFEMDNSTIEFISNSMKYLDIKIDESNDRVTTELISNLKEFLDDNSDKYQDANTIQFVHDLTEFLNSKLAENEDNIDDIKDVEINPKK